MSDKKRKLEGGSELQFQKAVDSANTPEELKKLISDLKSATSSAKEKLLSLSVDIEDLVELVESNQAQQQNLNRNMCGRSVESKFLIGPNKHPLTLDIENENIEGDDNVRVETELFMLEEEEFSGMSKEELNNFFTATGITHFNSEKYSGDDQDKAKMYFFGGIIKQMVQMLNDKHGREDNCGVQFGFEPDDIYELLENNIPQ